MSYQENSNHISPHLVSLLLHPLRLKFAQRRHPAALGCRSFPTLPQFFLLPEVLEAGRDSHCRLQADLMPSTVAPRNEVFNQRELGKCRERSQYNEHSFTSKSVLDLLLEIHCLSFHFKYTFIFVKEKTNSLQ